MHLHWKPKYCFLYLHEVILRPAQKPLGTLSVKIYNLKKQTEGILFTTRRWWHRLLPVWDTPPWAGTGVGVFATPTARQQEAQAHLEIVSNDFYRHDF